MTHPTTKSKRCERLTSIRATLVVLLLAGGGCQNPSHEQAKKQADSRWREVRSRVKLQLGRQQLEGGLFEDATTTLSEAVALDPSCAETYALLTQANLELGKPASAEQFLQAARSRGLESADLHYFQGVVFEQRNQADLALGEYQRAGELDPGLVDALVARAEILVSTNRAAEALQLLEASLDRFDDNATVSTLAGHVAARLGDRAKAAIYLTRASLKASDDPRIAESLALQLVELSRCEQAVPLLQTLVDAEHESSAARRALAECLLQKGGFSAVVGLLADYTKDHPDDEPAISLLTQAYLESGDEESAQRTLDRLTPEFQSTPSAQLLAAAIEWRRTEFAAAADRLFTLLDRQPSFSPGYALLAQVLRDQNLPDEAKHCEQRAEQLQLSRSGS